MMRRAAIALLGLGGLLAGCSASEEASDMTSSGGQTGSLVPFCGVGAARTVPVGDQAFVFHTEGCPTADLSAIRITDAAGNEIPVELEPLDGGAFLVRTEQVLSGGAYQVALPPTEANATSASAATLAVSAEAPLPTRIGDLTVVAEGCERSHLSLTLDPELLPYAALTQLGYRIDGGAPVPIKLYGELSEAGEPVSIEIPRCQATCLDEGPHRIELTATIAGESSMPDPVAADFLVACEEPSSGCRMTVPARPGGGLSLLMLSLAAALWQRRSTNRRRNPDGTPA